jgi:hypothetical protein
MSALDSGAFYRCSLSNEAAAHDENVPRKCVEAIGDGSEALQRRGRDRIENKFAADCHIVRPQLVSVVAFVVPNSAEQVDLVLPDDEVALACGVTPHGREKCQRSAPAV